MRSKKAIHIVNCHAGGEIGDVIVGGVTCFEGVVSEEFDFHGKPAILPVISGQAWIHGSQQHYLDPTDPFESGYRLSDTWPHY